MKKIIFGAALVLLSTFSFAQDQPVTKEKVVTTEEEYNFLTQGYAITKKTGGDIKAGYELKAATSQKFEEFEVSYSTFKHVQSNKVKAILIIVKKDKDKDDKIRYLCLPFNNPALLQDFWNTTEDLGLSLGGILRFSLYKTLAEALNDLTNNK